MGVASFSGLFRRDRQRGGAPKRFASEVRCFRHSPQREVRKMMDGISVLLGNYRQRNGMAMLVTALVLGMSIPRAAAQLTTGTVFGSVQDAQSAAVPSVTVSLISETRGTRLPDAISATSGEFVFANVPPDTYTLEIAHAHWHRRDRWGPRWPWPHYDPSRRTDRVRNRHRRRLAVADSERGAVGHDYANRGPERPARDPDFHKPDRRSSGGRWHCVTAIPRRGLELLFRRQREHHDGRCFHDGFRQQRPRHRGEYGSDRGD